VRRRPSGRPLAIVAGAAFAGRGAKYAARVATVAAHGAVGAVQGEAGAHVVEAAAGHSRGRGRGGRGCTG
jgi:hypothetical protein